MVGLNAKSSDCESEKQRRWRLEDEKGYEKASRDTFRIPYSVLGSIHVPKAVGPRLPRNPRESSVLSQAENGKSDKRNNQSIRAHGN